MYKKMMLTLVMLIGASTQIQASVETDKAMGFLGTLASSVVTSAAAFYTVKGIAKDKDNGSKVLKMTGAAALIAGGSFLGRLIMGSTLGDDAKIYGSGIDLALGTMIGSVWNSVNDDELKLNSPLAAVGCTVAIKGIVTALMTMDIKR